MKIQSLAIIFIIIIMPITIVLSEYIENKITTAETEMKYNTKLLNSTYDAIKAYQLNTVNNAFGDVTNQKIEDIEAAVKTFYNSIVSNFNYTGYKAEVMKEYVPAIVFTLYDGYYIYSPFNNTLTEVEDGSYDTKFSNKGTIQEGLKPYVYYTCRYTKDTNYDFVITYTLDNYITIQGNVNGQFIYDYGYLYSIANTRNEKGIYKDGDTYWYDGVQFTESDIEELREFVGITEYSYAKINGKKYYLNEDYYSDRGDSNITVDDVTFKASSGIFFIDSDGTKNYSQTKGYSTTNSTEENNEFLRYYRAIKKNKSAYEYYKNAYEFSKAVLGSAVSGYKDKVGTNVNGYNLSGLKSSNAYIWNHPASDSTSIQEYGDISIFDDTSNKIQNLGSNFDQHRKTIIRYVVETNLAASISGFSSQAGGSSFIMPKISETDWEIIENDVCVISFLQGMSIGTKRYNGYSVVANTLTKEYIDENDIYILTKDPTTNINTYCKTNDSEIYNDGANIKPRTELGYYPGIWKLNFEQKLDVSSSSDMDPNPEDVYYFPMSYKDGDIQRGYLGSYTSIMGSSKINSIATSDMYTYISGANQILKKTYYVALGRERWGAYNVNNINYEIYGNNGNEYFLKDY